MSKIQWYLLAAVLILLLPLWMWLAWFFTPKKKLVVAIIDKTVLTPVGQEHISLTWILNHNRYTKTHRKDYDISADYFGFFPLQNEKFRIKGLERFSPAQLQQLSDDADMVYVTDTYGIYKNEWYSGKNSTERSGILYGGMSFNDLVFLHNMKQKHKLIIAEFNSIASPTSSAIRERFEQEFAMHWSGWIARYFDSLDTLKNKEIPKWLIKNYKREHENKWPFHKQGIAYVNDDDRVAVLEDSTHLVDPMPYIITYAYGQKQLGLPAKIKYPYWFDIIKPDLSVNHAISRFNINTNANGTAELKKYGIPLTCPAILMHNDTDYRFYYFSGDFCDNPINLSSSYFRGINYFKWLLYDERDPVERGSFFWNFYQPLITNMLDQYHPLRHK